MAQQTEFITIDDYDRSARHIRGEFSRQALTIDTGNKQLRDDIKQIRDNIETGNKQLRNDFDNKLATVNGTLSGKLGELNTELGTVKKDLQSLKEEVHSVKEEVHSVKEEVHSVKEEVHSVKEEHGTLLAQHGALLAQHGALLTDLGNRLVRMEGVRMNATLSRLYETITPIGRFTPGIGLELPSDFPRTAQDFWNLKFKPTDKNIKRLISLVHFYGIDDYQYWRRTHVEYIPGDVDDPESDDTQSSSDSASSVVSLEDAVRQDPFMAVEKVAAVLGLVEENFAAFRRRALELAQRPQSVEKRTYLQQAQTWENPKRQRLQVQSSPQLPKPTMTLAELLQGPASESTKSKETQIEYGDTSTTRRHREKMFREPRSNTPSVTNPDGSPTVPNESPRVEKASLSGSHKQSNSQRSETSGNRARKGR